MPASTSRAERVALLLERSPLSPDEFVAALGLPNDVTPADVLSGAYNLSPSDLVAAADLLEVPVTVLTGDLPIDRHLGVSLRLGRVEAAAEAPIEALSFADALLGQQAVLDSWLEPVPSRLAGVAMHTGAYRKDAGQRSADRARRLLHLGDGPVEDLVGLVEGLGFPVAFRRLPPKLHGLNVRDEREGRPTRVILVSTRGGWPMQRFTLAHELCHALYDDPGQVIVDRVDVPEVLTELRAEAFARELLLPRRGLAEDLKPSGTRRGRPARDWHDTVPRLMVRWGVSRDAVVRALVEDGHATSEELAAVRASKVSALIAGAGLADAWRELCGDENLESGSPLLVERAVQAYGNGWVSSRFVADVLGEDQQTTERHLAAAGWPVSSAAG
jgi:IrrE N-terminal-like domain